MLQNINTVGHKQHYSAAPMVDQLTIMVEMPARFEGRPVSSRAVMISLFWQQYGLDLLHPKFSRWLEQNAPDVKYAVAQNSVKNGVNAGLRVGADGKVKVELPLEFDQRLREVSSQYKTWQMRPKMEQMRPKIEQARPKIEQMKPKIEQEYPIATIVYLDKASVSQNMDRYKHAC